MRHDDTREDFEGFLWGEVALIALMGAGLALFLSKPTLRGTWDLPELRLMLMTLYAVGGGLVALLSASRFSAEGRRFDLLLCGGFLIGSVAWVAFSIIPEVAGIRDHRAITWAGLAGVLVGWALIAIAPFAPHFAEELWQRTGHRPSIFFQKWPKWEEAYTTADTVTVAVQINERCIVNAASAFYAEPGLQCHIGEMALAVVLEQVGGIAVIRVEIGKRHLPFFVGATPASPCVF